MNLAFKKSESGLERKERILDAALLLFADFGYHGVAVPKIAEQAGVATGSVYNYFASKDELVNELYWNWKQTLKALFLTDYPGQAPTEQQFQFIWQKLFLFADRHPKAFQFIESHLHSSYLSTACIQLEDELFEIGRGFVRSGQEAGVLKPGPPQLMVSMFFGAFTQFFKDSRAERLEWNQINSDSLRDFCWRAMSL